MVPKYVPTIQNMIAISCQDGRTKEKSVWPNAVNGRTKTIVVASTQSPESSNDGYGLRTKKALVRNENIKTN